MRNAHARRGRGGVVRVVEAARAGVDVLVVHQLSVHEAAHVTLAWED